MSILEQITNEFSQTIALDGRQYTRLESNPESIPNIKVNYEWNVNKFQPDRVDPSTYDAIGNHSRKPADTFDLSSTQRELQAHLRELIANLQRISAETSEENKKRLDKLEKGLIDLMKIIEQEKQDTINKTNESFKLLEEAKAFIKDEDARM